MALRRIVACLSQTGRTRTGRWLWFGLSLLLFVLVLLAGNPATRVTAIVIVILVHELGHYLGMRCFGYRDARILFIPFFGAAAAGWKLGVPTWQQAVVVLLGPLPGLVAGCVLWLWVQDKSQSLLNELALWSVALNLLNLIPLEPLDGGRFVNLVLFHREPVPEAIVVAMSALFLLWVSVVFLDSLILLGLAVAIIMQIPGRYRTAKAARIVAGHWPNLPLGATNLTEGQLRDAFRAVLRCFPETNQNTMVVAMYRVLEQAAIRPWSLPARAGFMALYASAVWLAMYTGVAATIPSTLFPPRPDWLKWHPPDKEPTIRLPSTASDSPGGS